MISKVDYVTFRIDGGLGNQLFMLAAGLYYQEQTKKEVIFDISNLESISKLHPGHNVYSLGLLKNSRVFQTSLNQKNYPEGILSLRRAKSKIQGKIIEPIRRSAFVVPEVGFFDLSMIPPRVTRIEGYFQSWKYFDGLTNKPIVNIDLLKSPSQWFLNLAETLTKESFTALHVRRGDYKLAKNRQNGLLSRRYYEETVYRISHVGKILVFSDSPTLARELFTGSTLNLEFIEPPHDSDPVESLLLMSIASNIIISNSTFAMWAAMLSNPATSVFAPHKWFEFGRDPVDLMPESWNFIESEWEIQ